MDRRRPRGRFLGIGHRPTCNVCYNCNPRPMTRSSLRSSCCWHPATHHLNDRPLASPKLGTGTRSSVSGPLCRPGLHPHQTLRCSQSYQVPAKTPPRLTSMTRAALATSPRSYAESSRSNTTDGSLLSAVHFILDPSMPQSNCASVWEGDGDASTTFEMETEVAELNDLVDKDVRVMIDSPTTLLIAYCHYFFLSTARSPQHCKASKSRIRR